MKNKAFSLIELLVSIVIITVGVFAAMQVIAGAQKSIRDTRERNRYVKIDNEEIILIEQSGSFRSPNFWINNGIVYNETHKIDKNIIFNVLTEPVEGLYEIHLCPNMAPVNIVNGMPEILILTCQVVKDNKILDVFTYMKGNDYFPDNFDTKWAMDQSRTGTFFRFRISVKKDNVGYYIDEFKNSSGANLRFEDYQSNLCLTYKINPYYMRIQREFKRTILMSPIADAQVFVALEPQDNRGNIFNKDSTIDGSTKYSSVLFASASYPPDLNHPYELNPVEPNQYLSPNDNTFFMRPFSQELSINASDLIGTARVNIWTGNGMKFFKQYKVPAVLLILIEDTVETTYRPDINQSLVGTPVDWINDPNDLIEGLIYKEVNHSFCKQVLFMDPIYNQDSEYYDNRYFIYEGFFNLQSRLNWKQQSDGTKRTIKKNIMIARNSL